MSNLADDIERYILKRLFGSNTNVVVIRRNELAQELNCAPSQISYVLNTRFTTTRGYIVEARRGSGGFVRIARIPAGVSGVLRQYLDECNCQLTRADLLSLIHSLRREGLITEREAAILEIVFSVEYFGALPAENRGEMVKAVLLTLLEPPL